MRAAPLEGRSKDTGHSTSAMMPLNINAYKTCEVSVTFCIGITISPARGGNDHSQPLPLVVARFVGQRDP
jgi:hypothetical protein